MQIQKNGSSSTNTTESSVLFSLASLGAMAKPAPVAAKPAAKVEDLLGIGATPSAVLAPPVIAPVVIAKPVASAPSTRVWIACALMMAVGILGGSYAVARAMLPAAAPRVVVQTVTVPVVDETPTAIEAPIPETEIAIATPEATPTEPVTATAHPRVHHVDPVVVATPPVAEHPHGPLTLEQLVQQAVHETDPVRDPAHPHAATPPASTLAATPSRSDVVTAMTSVTPAVSACGPDHGVATVSMTISHTGRVTSAVVTGPLAGTPTGSCVARAARAAHFPEFSRDTFSLNYPFRI